ncbi:hypothetical protein R3X27_14815 [Tropicimonas sp. TH_r6]|nr:hypothetical protein [Tropicimonas sp. TH_r6]MDV7143957.1 hypothetical protein [Tropicimonas sp. TH_r6]
MTKCPSITGARSKKAARDFAAADVEVAAVTLSEDMNDRVCTTQPLYLEAMGGRDGASLGDRELSRTAHFRRIVHGRVTGGVANKDDLRLMDARINSLTTIRDTAIESGETAQAELTEMTGNAPTLGSASPIDMRASRGVAAILLEGALKLVRARMGDAAGRRMELSIQNRLMRRLLEMRSDRRPLPPFRLLRRDARFRLGGRILHLFDHRRVGGDGRHQGAGRAAEGDRDPARHAGNGRTAFRRSRTILRYLLRPLYGSKDAVRAP